LLNHVAFFVFVALSQSHDQWCILGLLLLRAALSPACLTHTFCAPCCCPFFAEPVRAPAATASSLLHHVMTPQAWGVFTGRFNASKALRACAAYSSIGVVPTITAMLFDYVYAPWLLRKGLAVRTSDYLISAPWQKIAWDMFAATMITMMPLVAFGTFISADGMWPVVLEYGFEPFQMLWATVLMLLVRCCWSLPAHPACPQLHTLLAGCCTPSLPAQPEWGALCCVSP
jgi:hypothetical protein